MKILVVDDEKVLVKGIKFNLESEGYQVEVGYDGQAAVDLARGGAFDLIILDLMMPRIDGLQACMRIREFSNVPIIILTAKGEDADKLMGFECGADDYITKPFSAIELVARVKSHLRRYLELGGAGAGGSVRRVGRLEYDFDAHSLLADGAPVKLTPTETRIMELFMKNPGRIFSAEEIYARVWNEAAAYAPENTVMVHIRRIREKIELNPKEPEYLKVVWGLGYRLEKK